MSKGNFRLQNFWTYQITEADETWFARFIIHRFSSFPNVLLSSVLGPRRAICPDEDEFWIHYSGENTFDRYPEYNDHEKLPADLTMDFWPEIRPNAIRFPIWVWYFFKPEWNIKDISRTLAEAELKKTKILKRKFPFAMVAGHEGFHDCPRGKMVSGCADANLHLMSEGRFASNSNVLSTEYSNDLMEYLADVQFYFCPENSQAIGYTTEKIFSGVLNGTIPVYWGSGGVPEFDVLNQERIIKIEDNNINGSINRIDEMLSKPVLLQEFAMQPIFKEEAATRIYEYYRAFENHLLLSGKFE